MIETILTFGKVIVSLCVSSLVLVSAHQGATTGLPDQLTAKAGINITKSAKLASTNTSESTSTSESSSTADDTNTISAETTQTPLIEEVTATVPAIEATLMPISPVAFDSTKIEETTASASTIESQSKAENAPAPAPAPAANPAPAPVQPPSTQDIASSTAQRYGIPPQLFFALINQESGWNSGARSAVGALGLTQVMPSNIVACGYDIEAFKSSPALQLELGAKLLSDNFRTFGRWDFALAAYNAGPGAVSRYHGVPPYGETINYVRSILAMAGM